MHLKRLQRPMCVFSSGLHLLHMHQRLTSQHPGFPLPPAASHGLPMEQQGQGPDLDFYGPPPPPFAFEGAGGGPVLCLLPLPAPLGCSPGYGQCFQLSGSYDRHLRLYYTSQRPTYEAAGQGVIAYGVWLQRGGRALGV
jgi:hypothetical protein